MRRSRSPTDVAILNATQAFCVERAPTTGDLLENRFRIEAGIAKGTNAFVYAATNIVTNKVVAIKWPRRRRSFESVVHEARLAARVQHAGVVDVYDVGQHEGTFFLTMEYIRGGSLGSWIASRGFERGAFLPVFEAILSAVRAVHSCGIVHCDLKPSNILLSVSAEGLLRQPKVIDFGSAKAFSHAPDPEARLVHAGSAPYMPPEQLNRLAALDRRADIFALGMILDAYVRGRCGASSDNSSHASLRGVVARATAANTSDRFADTSAFLDALRAASKSRRLRAKSASGGCQPVSARTSARLS